MNDYILLSPAEVAERLRVSTATLERWRRNGTGPSFVKAGPGLRSRVGYRAEDLNDYISARTVQSTAEMRERGW